MKEKEKIKKMASLLKYSFIPTEKNHHKPHMLHEVTLVIIISISLFLSGISFARYYFLHGTVRGQEIVSSVLIDITNETRQKYGESPLKKNSLLEQASGYKAEDMATYQYFAHNSPTGKTPWYWLKQVGYDFIYAGENLAVDFTKSRDVSDAWMKSPTHKANILNSKFTEIGITVKEGIIDGHNTIYVVQMFGTPKEKKVITETVSTASSVIINDGEVATNEEAETGEVAGIFVENNFVAGTTLVQNDIKVDPNNNESVLLNATTTNTDEANQPAEENYITLIDGNNIVIVADKEEFENATDTDIFTGVSVEENNFEYSTPWQKFIYNFWYNLNTFYKIVMTLLGISLISFSIVEYRRGHWAHMLYGVITMLILMLLLYLNQGLW